MVLILEYLHVESGFAWHDPFVCLTGANIFLANGGNCLKLGDFGCAAQIKSHTTMAGEIQGIVGTQGKYPYIIFLTSVIIKDFGSFFLCL